MKTRTQEKYVLRKEWLLCTTESSGKLWGREKKKRKSWTTSPTVTNCTAPILVAVSWDRFRLPILWTRRAFAVPLVVYDKPKQIGVSGAWVFVACSGCTR